MTKKVETQKFPLLLHLYFMYDVPLVRFGMCGYIENVKNLRVSIKQNHTIKEVELIKDTLKVYTDLFQKVLSLITVISFILTFTWGAHTFMLQQAMKSVDWSYQANIFAIQESVKGYSLDKKIEIYGKYLNQMQQDFSTKMSQLDSKTTIEIGTVLVPLLLIVVYLVIISHWIQMLYINFESVHKELLENENVRKALYSRK